MFIWGVTWVTELLTWFHLNPALLWSRLEYLISYWSLTFRSGSPGLKFTLLLPLSEKPQQLLYEVTMEESSDIHAPHRMNRSASGDPLWSYHQVKHLVTPML